MSTQQALPITAKTPGDAAALWWVAVLTNPKLDNGTQGEPMMDALIAMAEEGPHPIAEELAEFGGILARMLNEQLDDDGDRYMIEHYGIGLSVDYHPDSMLSQAADEAGLRLHMGQWPWKTSMRVKSDEVTVWYGYSATEPQVIWTKS